MIFPQTEVACMRKFEEQFQPLVNEADIPKGV